MRLILIAALLASAATPAGAKKDREAPAPTQGSSAEPENPYPSTYKAYPGVATAISTMPV